MSAAEGHDGPSDVIPLGPSSTVGVTAHAGFMEYMQNLPASSVAIPVQKKSDSMHNIDTFQIVCMLDAAMLKKLGYNQGMNSQDRNVGRPLVIGQGGQLPHGLRADFRTTDYGRALTEDEFTRIKIQAAKELLVPIGMSLASYRKTKDAYATTETIGISVVIHGVMTGSFYTGQTIPNFSFVAVTLIPQVTGRSGIPRYIPAGSVEKYPFTIEPVNYMGQSKHIRTNIHDFQTKITEAGNSRKWLFVQAVQPLGGNGPMLNGHKNAANLVAGVLSISAGIIEKLIRKGILAFNPANNLSASAAETIVGTNFPSGSGSMTYGQSAEAWIEKGLDVFCLSDLNKMRANTSTNYIPLVAELIKVITGDAKSESRSRNALFETLTGSGLEMVLSGCLDHCNKAVKPFGQVVGVRTGSFDKPGNGMADYDIYVGKH